MFDDNRDARLGGMLFVLALVSCCGVTILPTDVRLLVLAPVMVAMLAALVLILRGDGTTPFR